MDESEVEVNHTFMFQREQLKSKGFKLNITTTKYLERKSSNKKQKSKESVTIVCKEVEERNQFIIQEKLTY